MIFKQVLCRRFFRMSQNVKLKILNFTLAFSTILLFTSQNVFQYGGFSCQKYFKIGFGVIQNEIFQKL